MYSENLWIDKQLTIAGQGGKPRIGSTYSPERSAVDPRRIDFMGTERPVIAIDETCRLEGLVIHAFHDATAVKVWQGSVSITGCELEAAPSVPALHIAGGEARLTSTEVRGWNSLDYSKVGVRISSSDEGHGKAALEKCTLNYLETAISVDKGCQVVLRHSSINNCGKRGFLLVGGNPAIQIAGGATCVAEDNDFSDNKGKVWGIGQGATVTRNRNKE
jgi:hypothetical protein